ncbi:MAG: MFS transporter [Woeseia sp.]|nr:MFS transporter [Woeseia sp.]
MTETQAGPQTAMLPAERRVVGIVAGVAVLRMFGLFALLPVLAIFSAGLDGATPLLIGIAVGGYGLTQALLQVPFGTLSDKVGRVPVLLGGLALFAAGSLLAATSDTIWGVVAGRLLQGAGAVSATLTALLADATRENVRTRTMAILGIAIGSSFLLALILGPVVAANFGVRSLFWLAALLAVVAALLVLTLPRALWRSIASPRLRLGMALRPELLRLDLFVFLLHAMLTASFVALPFVMSNALQLPLAAHWHLYVMALLLSLLGAVPLIVADDRQGKRWTLTVAVLLLLVGQVLLWTAGEHRLQVLGGLAIFFAGFNFLEAGLPARLSIMASAELRGASLGVFASCQFAGAFVGGVLGGVLLGSGKPESVFIACAAMAALWLLVESPRALKRAENA